MDKQLLDSLSLMAKGIGIEFDPKTTADINMQPQKAEGYVNHMLNKLVKQEGMDPMDGITRHPLKVMIGKYNLPIAEIIELYVQNVLPVQDYDVKNWVPANGQQWVNDNLVAYSQTELKKQLTQSMNKNVLSLAFTSAGNMAQWLSRYNKKREQSWDNYEYPLIQEFVLPNVITSFEVDCTDKIDNYTEFQTGLIKMAEILSSSTGNPTYGYAADGRGRIFNWVNTSDYVLCVSPKTMASLSARALPNLFNKQYLDVKEMFDPSNVMKLNGVKDNEFIILHRDFFKLLHRIEGVASQFFALNLEYIINEVRWYNPVLFPWMNAFRINFKTTDDKEIIEAGYKLTGNPVSSVNFNLNNLGATSYNLISGDYIEVRVISKSNTKDYNMNDGTGFNKAGGKFYLQTFYNATGTEQGGHHKYMNDNKDITTTYVAKTSIPTGNSNLNAITLSSLSLPAGSYVAQCFGYLNGKRFSSSGVEILINASKQVELTQIPTAIRNANGSYTLKKAPAVAKK